MGAWQPEHAPSRRRNPYHNPMTGARQATNADFANRLYAAPEVAKSPRFAKPKLDPTGFTIQHYAGGVQARAPAPAPGPASLQARPVARACLRIRALPSRAGL